VNKQRPDFSIEGVNVDVKELSSGKMSSGRPSRPIEIEKDESLI